MNGNDGGIISGILKSSDIFIFFKYRKNNYKRYTFAFKGIEDHLSSIVKS